MNPLTVIIPSRNAKNLVPCVEAVQLHEPGARIIVVDDGLDGLGMVTLAAYSDEPVLLNPTYIEGAKPFVFARNVNLGIRNAATRPIDVSTHAGGARRYIDGIVYPDVVLLNDDAILETPGGFRAMQQSATDHPDVAIVSSTTNVCNNPAQYPRSRPLVYVRDHLEPESGRPELRIARRAPGFTFPVVAFVCVLIPARTIETIGLLDERFTAYGWEDVDYCRRIHDAGLSIGIDDRCFVDHGRLTSTFRGDPRAGGDIEPGKRIYLEKWGRL